MSPSFWRKSTALTSVIMESPEHAGQYVMLAGDSESWRSCLGQTNSNRDGRCGIWSFMDWCDSRGATSAARDKGGLLGGCVGDVVLGAFEEGGRLALCANSHLIGFPPQRTKTVRREPRFAAGDGAPSVVLSDRRRSQRRELALGTRRDLGRLTYSTVRRDFLAFVLCYQQVFMSLSH